MPKTPLAPAPSWRRALTPNVVRLGAVSFFADVSSEMLYPLMPLFLTVTLGAPVAAVGVIEGIAEGAASLLKTVSGRIADATGRRKELVVGGYSLSAIAKPLIALAPAWPSVLLARVLDRTGKGFRSAPRDAILADSVEPGLRGSAFGVHRAMDTLGAVVGPLIALALISMTGGNLRFVIGLALIPGLVGAFVAFSIVDKRSAVPMASASALRLSWAALPGRFRQYLVAWLPFVFVNSSDVFLILRAREIGFSTTAVVLLYTLYNLVYSVASVPLGHLSDRVGRRRVLIGGMAVFAAVYSGLAAAHAPWQIAVLFVIYGVYIAATDGVGKAFAVDLVPSDQRATSVGLLGTLTGLATLVASSIAGVLWDGVGSWAPFALGALGALVSGIMLTALPAGLPAPKGSGGDD